MASRDPLEFSLNFEIDGANLYLNLAKSSKNVLGKHLFYTLAVQEVEHARRFDEIYRSIRDKSGLKEIPFGVTNIAGVETELKEFFEKAKALPLKEDKEDVAPYSLAMEMEEKGHRAYSEFLKKAVNEMERKFFECLIAEELGHLEALRNVYYYLTGTGDWFENDESRIWNWMNI